VEEEGESPEEEEEVANGEDIEAAELEEDGEKEEAEEVANGEEVVKEQEQEEEEREEEVVVKEEVWLDTDTEEAENGSGDGESIKESKKLTRRQRWRVKRTSDPHTWWSFRRRINRWRFSRRISRGQCYWYLRRYKDVLKSCGGKRKNWKCAQNIGEVSVSKKGEIS